MVVIMDDEDRENEGDLLMAASSVNAQDINFMARYGRGLICLTLSEARCRQLRLPQMVDNTDDMHGTNFTVSIEAAEGVTTGISAADRAITVQAAVAPDATSQDIVQPGHIFPLKAQPGGVLNRAGHTEAGCDLARLAGFEPAAVIVEILNDDGTMARRPDLEKFAKEHDLKIGTIEDLIRYRIQNEKTVERVAESDFHNEFGQFRLYAYQDEIGNDLHLALVHGKIDPDKPVRVRVHMESTMCDVLASSKKCGWPLRDAMKEIADADEPGVIVILREAESARQIMQWMLGHNEETHSDDSNPKELRTHGIGAQILMDLDVKKMRLMAAPMRIHGLAAYGLEVVDYITGDE